MHPGNSLPPSLSTSRSIQSNSIQSNGLLCSIFALLLQVQTVAMVITVTITVAVTVAHWDLTVSSPVIPHPFTPSPPRVQCSAVDCLAPVITKLLIIAPCRNDIELNYRHYCTAHSTLSITYVSLTGSKENAADYDSSLLFIH